MSKPTKSLVANESFDQSEYPIIRNIVVDGLEPWIGALNVTTCRLAALKTPKRNWKSKQ